VDIGLKKSPFYGKLATRYMGFRRAGLENDPPGHEKAPGKRNGCGVSEHIPT